MANSFLGRKARTRGIQRQRGMSLLETAAVLSVASVAMGMFATTMADNAEQVKAKGVAEKIIEIQAAAKMYIDAEQEDLNAAITSAGGPVVIPVGRLNPTDPYPTTSYAGLLSVQGAGYLPPSYRDTNGYNQRHALIVKRVNVSGTDRLEAIVTTHSGNPIPDRQLARIASHVGASGGFVPSAAGAPSYGGSGNSVVGYQGGWGASGTDWGTSGPRPVAGSAVASLGFSDAGIVKDYLYRNGAAGQEGNTMRAHLRMAPGGTNNILMNGNTIDGSGRVTGTRIVAGASVSGAEPPTVQPGATLYSSGAVVVGTHPSNSMPAGIDVWTRNGIRTETDITARGSITAETGNIHAQGGQVRAATGVVSDAGITAAANIESTGGNISANSGTVYAGTEVRAPLFRDSNNTAYYVDPNDISRVSDVQADYLNVTARVHGVGSLTKTTSSPRLADLLPRWVAQAGWAPSGTTMGVTNLVPVPTCPSGGTPRIVLNPMNDSYRFDVVVDRTTAAAVTNVTRDAANNLYVSHGTFVNAIGSSGQQTTFARQYTATLSGANWIVNLTGAPQHSGAPWQVHATTYCQYSF